MDIVKTTQNKVEATKKKLAKTIELKSYRKLAVNFLILSINLIIIILYFSLSQAKILIVPAKEEILHTVSLPVKSEVSLEDEELSIKGSITSVEVEHTQSFPVEATSTVDKNASGTVIIRNTTSDRRQIFVSQTRFKNDAGIEIKIKQKVEIPPGESVSVSALSSKAGKKGEITKESGRFQVVALAYLKDKIYAEVKDDFTGGTEQLNALTPTEFNTAKAKMEDAMRQKGFEILSQSNGKIPEKNDLVLEVKNLSSTANPGDTGVKEFTVSSKGTVSAFVYDEDRAREIVKQGLIKNIPPDKILIEFNDNSFTASLNKDGLKISATISAMVQTKIPQAALSQKEVVGMNESEVREHFTRITGIRDVQIEFWPFWVRSVPNLKDHVDIEIKK